MLVHSRSESFGSRRMRLFPQSKAALFKEQ